MQQVLEFIAPEPAHGESDDGFVAEHEIPLSFFDGFGSGVPVQSHSFS